MPKKMSQPIHHVAKCRLWMPYHANRKKPASAAANMRLLESCRAISVWPGVKEIDAIPEIAEAIPITQKKRQTTFNVFKREASNENSNQFFGISREMSIFW